MTQTIARTLTFDTTPERLYRLYTNAREHAASTGMNGIQISAKPGGRFLIEGAISGRILALRPGQLVVQTWRGAKWKKSEPDSLLVLAFERAPRGTHVHLLHTHIPEAHYAGILHGWPHYYWKPWRAYLKKRAR